MLGQPCLTQLPNTHMTNPVPAKEFEGITATSSQMSAGKRGWKVCIPLIKLFTMVLVLLMRPPASLLRAAPLVQGKG